MKQRYVIAFAGENGNDEWLYVRRLHKGQDGVTLLTRSIYTGQTAVRKFALKPARNRKLTSKEVFFQQLFSDAGLAPLLHFVEGHCSNPASLTMEHCDGLDAARYYNSLQLEEQRAAFSWLFLAEGLRLLAYLHHGILYESALLNSENRLRLIDKQKDWQTILHNDPHPGNFFVAFGAGLPSMTPLPPLLLIGDFGHTRYLSDTSHDGGARTCYSEVLGFLRDVYPLTGIKVRVSRNRCIVIDQENNRAEFIASPQQRSQRADALALWLVEHGFYQMCIQRYNSLCTSGVKLPKPHQKNMPRQFESTQPADMSDDQRCLDELLADGILGWRWRRV